MPKKTTIISLTVVFCAFLVWLLWGGVGTLSTASAERSILKARQQVIEDNLAARRLKNADGSTADPFGEDGVVRVLLLGLDSRVGEENGHCDAIQLLTIDKDTGGVTITAVPRGTYSPLPPGVGKLPSDYYISNACGLVGLAYGITQIEKTIGAKADYVAVVGFSETLGILRFLHLPSTKTLQWLRNRHGYAIGEPQRAHNHSTFIKQMLIRFVAPEASIVDTPWHYVIYSLIKTDLSFTQAQSIFQAIADMSIVSHPEKIRLSMRPAFAIQDIAYDAENIDANLDKTLGPLKNILSPEDYSTESGEAMQIKLLSTISDQLADPVFISWAYTNKLWYQIEDGDQSLAVQYDITVAYISSVVANDERESVIVDYIIEMESRGQSFWQNKGRDLLAQEVTL